MDPLDRLFVALLFRLYPTELRARFRSECLAFLREQRREERYELPVIGRLRFWADILGDLLTTLAHIRRERRQRRERASCTRTITMNSILQDVRFAIRTLRRRPLYAGVAILTLGLGIGAATSMFSVVDGVLLQDVQYRDADRLMSIWQRLEGRTGYTAAGETRLQYNQYEALRDQSTAFQEVAVYAADWGESTLGGGSRPELIMVGPATASLLPALGITPALGRWFGPEEEGAEAGDRAMVTVMSHEIWVRRFAGDPNILGSSVLINGLPFTVIGILPEGFRLQWLTASISGADDPGPRDFWVPVGSPEWGEAPGSTMWEAVGRLADGVTMEQARAEASRILAEAWPTLNPTAIITSRTQEEVRGIGSPILLLFGATGLLLLIACGNVGALSLGEIQGRMQEVATRAAIGAGRLRVARQLVTESLVLGLAGSALGALVAIAFTRVFVVFAPPIPRMDQVHVNPGVLAFAAALGTLSGILFGLAPALVSSRSAVSPTLRAGGRTGTRRQLGLGRLILGGEVALTIMLLVAGGLLARSLTRLLDVELGFRPEQIATVEVGLPDARYGWSVKGAAWGFMDEVLREMEGIPDASAVTAANLLPFPDSPAEWGSRAHREDSTYLMPELYNVAPGYLDFMGIPVLEGRGILPSDNADAPAIAVVSRSLARALWGDRSPVGLEMFYPMGAVTVVGVAGDTRQATLQDDPPLTFYVPFAQHSRTRVTFAARTRGRPEDVLSAMREALWAVDPELAITGSGSLEGAIVSSASEERYRTLIMAAFALLATLLSAVGIGGVTARQVSQRTRELGIRKALGAPDTKLVGGVVRSAAITGLAGVGAGLAGVFWLRPILAAFLFGVETFDPLVYGGMGALFVVISAAAAYLPARKLLEVDPVGALRQE